MDDLQMSCLSYSLETGCDMPPARLPKPSASRQHYYQLGKEDDYDMVPVVGCVDEQGIHHWQERSRRFYD